MVSSILFLPTCANRILTGSTTVWRMVLPTSSLTKGRKIILKTSYYLSFRNSIISSFNPFAVALTLIVPDCFFP